MIENVEGIVLRMEDMNEFDKRLTLYTKEYGKIRAKLVGVKKSASKLKSLTIPFIELRLQVYLAGNKRAGLNLPGKVVSGEIILDHPSVRNDWERMIQTTALCEILDVLTHPFYPNPKEYELLASTLCQMESTLHPEALKNRFILAFLKILGYSFIHHPLWKSSQDKEKFCIKALAVWDGMSDAFSKEDCQVIESVVRRYLSHYLPAPLKTEIFQQKVEILSCP